MDRPSRRTRDHHQRRSQQAPLGSLRGGQQQQLTSGGSYSSTDSDNEEGAAVYESLTPVRRLHNMPHSHSAMGPLSGDAMARLYNPNPHSHVTMPRMGEHGNSQDTKGVRTTNLDDDDHPSPLAAATRKDFAAAKIYQLLNFSPETASPETDDLNSETSNEHNVSECPTIPVHSSSHGGSYMNPSTASDISCHALSPHQLYQYGHGVQQLSVQHLHNPYLTASSHFHHHRPSNSIYCSNRDSHLLDDHHPDKHGPASSPTTTGSSDRCLLPTSSSGNICKLSSNNSVILTQDRHLFNPSMQQQSHQNSATDRAGRPLSEHYHATSILRAPQCPLHTGPGGLTYPNRTNLRPGSTAKPSQKSRGLQKVLTWRNLTIVLTLLCLALVAALGYFAVAVGNHRQDDVARCSRAQEVISHSQFDNGPVLRVRRNAETIDQSNGTSLNGSIELPPEDAESSEESLSSTSLDLVKNSIDNETSTISNSTMDSEFSSFLDSESSVAEEGWRLPLDADSTTETPSSTPKLYSQPAETSKNSTVVSENSTISPKNISLSDFMQGDAPQTRENRAFAGRKNKSFTILQTVLLSHYTDENGVTQPQLILDSPKVFSHNQLRGVSRAGRDVNDNESWDGNVAKGYSKDGYADDDHFVELTAGLTTELTIPARQLWLSRITQKKAGPVMLNLTISPAATLVLYGRRNLPPSHAEYDFVHTMRRDAQRTVRGADLTTRVFHENLDVGDWYMGLYNDQGKEESVTFSISEPENSYCSNDCSGQGSCIDGQCQCLAGFGGDDCSQTVCPLLCSGHGKYSQGSCQCFPGWKGNSCDTPEFQCDDPTCSGRGKCWTGKCVCDVGFTGARCETVQCPKECTQHGICQNGTCYCQPGWMGVLCDVPVNDARSLCSNHGSLDAQTQKCSCDAKWTGDSCSIEVCSPACGSHGECQNSRCACSPGWTGLTCDSPQCPACGVHGKCQNGSCLCEKGWSGRLCTIDNCPNECSKHGTCVQDGHAWKCQCEPLWKGDNCATQMERCDDGRDNDNDGLIDCADNDCCSADVCLSHINCIASPEPQEVLLREQAPPDTASFYDRVTFLIRENGVQSYVDRNAFDPKRVSVLRGRVVDSSNVGLAGVRISIQAPPGQTSPWGFTTTRRDGMFDLLFNGGGSHVINYQKNNYRDTSSSAALAWNEFGVMETVKMFRDTELAVQTRVGFLTSGEDSSTCELTLTRFQPRLFPFWKMFPSGGQGNGPIVYHDAQVLQESFNLSGSDIRLNHVSSRASGFASVLLVVLTRDSIAVGLDRVTVRITNAGVQEETVYDAQPNLSHVYSWNGTNAYKQVVYGFSNAKVSIGYEGRNCKDIFWVHQVVKMKGRDVPVSDIGSWDLSVHHRYNTEASILHRGDGANVYLSEGLLDVQSVVGTGLLRSVNCKDNCAVAVAATGDLLAPVALATAPDGSLYIGDFNLIRRVKPDGSIVTVLQIPSPAALQKYYIAVNPANGQLYISLSQLLKVIRIPSPTIPVDITSNYVTAVGTGMQCVPRAGIFSCGENIVATAASMIFPKGIAFDKTGSLYIADGGAIRLVDQAGIIKTLIPQTPYSTSWTPTACGEVIELGKLNLRWPTSLAVNPVDDSLSIVDDNMLVKLVRTRKVVEIISGSSLKCGANGNDVDTLTAVAVSLSGVVYVTEGTAEAWRIRRLSGDTTEIVLSSCDCNGTACGCVPVKKGAEIMQTPGAVTVGTDGTLYVADLKALKVFAVAPAVPRQNARMEYEVEAPEKGELYTFNRYGLHMETKDILTGQRKFKFSNNVDSALGKLRSVTDGNDKTCTIVRDYRNQVSGVECGVGWKTVLTNTARGSLKDVKYNGGAEINFAYDSDSGLIIGRTDSTARPLAYKYDQNGRLKDVVQSGGGRLQWPADFSTRLLSDPKFVRTESEGKMSLSSPSVALLVSSSSNLPFANQSAPSAFFLRLAGKNGSISGELSYPSQTSGRFRRSLTVNETTLFSVEFDPMTNEEFVLDRDAASVLSTKYDGVGRRVSVKPVVGDFAETKFTYDNIGRIIKWEHGAMRKSIEYTDQGLPALEKSANGATVKFDYNGLKQLIKVTKATGDEVLVAYDAANGVRTITSPKGNTLMLREEPFVSFRRISIRDSKAESAFSQDFSDKGQLIAQNYPSGLRKLALVYSSDNKLHSVYFGKHSVSYSYNENGFVNQVKKASDQLTSTKDITYFGSALIDSVGLKYSGNIDLESVTTRYEYDNGMNLIRRKLQVGTSDVSVTDFTTNHRTRQISRFGPFTVAQSHVGALIVSDANAMFMKQLNNLGKTRTHVLRLKERIVASAETIYNEAGHLAELKIRKGDSEPQLSFSFKYDLNGQLTEATRNKQAYWAYTYDGNGNLATASGSGDRFRNSTFGTHDEPTDAGTLTDQDGFVTKKGEMNYEYDAVGQVVRAWNGASDVKFHYDDQRRLIASQSSASDIVQFIYADLGRTDIVTHVYQKKTRTLTQLFYDVTGQLIAMARDGNPYYILQSKLSSTVFDQSGKVVKEVFFMPFGEVESDSNPDFYYPFDQGQNLRDATAKIVFHQGRPYDPETGRYLSPNFGDLRKMTLKNLNPYVYQENDPLLTSAEKKVNLGGKEWVKILGIQNRVTVGSGISLADLLETNCDMTSPLPTINTSCSLLPILNDFESLSLLSSSPTTLPDVLSQPLRFSSVLPFYSRNTILIANSNGTLDTATSGTGMRTINEAVDFIVSGAQMLPWRLSVGMKEKIFLVKKGDLPTLDQDINRLRTIVPAVNFTTKREAGDTSLQIQADNLLLNISYVRETKEGVSWFRDFFRDIAVRRAWEIESKRVTEGLAVSTAWSEAERTALRSQGSVPGYTGHLSRDISDVPELAGDPANVVFVRG